MQLTQTAFRVSLVLLATSCALLEAQSTPVRLLDIETTPGMPGRYDWSSYPAEFTPVGGALVFSANSSNLGRELFVTKGTTATTSLVKDVNPGALDSNPRELAAFGAQCLFTARTEATGYELFRTDGTAAGTTLVRDIVPGSAGSNPIGLTTFGGSVYFLLGDGSCDLWKSDGTSQGTVEVAKIGARTTWAPKMVATGNGKLLGFTVGNTMWLSDGTGAGTRQLLTFQVSSPLALTLASTNLSVYVGDEVSVWRCDAAGSRVLFNGRIHKAIGDVVYMTKDSRLWKAWDTGATGMNLVDIIAGEVNIAPEDAGGLYYGLRSTTSAYPIWRVDAKSKAYALTLPHSTAAMMFVHRGTLYSMPTSIVTNTLYATDLTTRSTLALAAVNLRRFDNGPHEWTPFGNQVVFYASDNAGGEPWVTDGSRAGTGMLADLCRPDAGRTAHSFPHHFLDVGGEAFFYATRPGQDSEFYRTDGTVNGTTRLTNIVTGSGSVVDAAMGRLGNELLFDGDGRLWVSDGTAAGTRFLSNVASPQNFAQLGGYLYFNSGGDLWRTDATAAGTTLVRAQTLVRSEAIGGSLYLNGNGPQGWEPWRFDGTTFTLVGDVNPSGDSSPDGFVRVGDHVVFEADVPALGREFFTVPLAGGTPTVLKDLHPNVARQGLGNWTHSTGDKMFFWDIVTGGARLCVTDGTSNGTLVLPVTTLHLYRFGSWGDGTAFVQTDHSVWKSDGTIAGTQKILEPTGDLNFPIEFEPRRIGSRRVAFKATSGPHYGYELWTSDGTTAGTQMVADLFAGFGDGCSPEGLGSDRSVVSNGRLLFAGDDGRSGEEPFAIELGAVSQQIGVGCKASGFVPVLSAEDPVLGTSFAIRIDDATANTTGALVLAAPLLGLKSAYLGSGCSLYVDTAALLLVHPLVTDASGRWSLPGMSVPNNPALRGVRFMMQAGIGPSSTAPLSYDLTNGVLCVLGT
ncbi:MAG: hypothetical protein KDC95_05160 [Planctomycetes bacterium]|nr:hypothetical protein [Planctomycetota bacterium]